MPHPPIETEWCRLYNADCIEGCKQHVVDSSVDLIITDPPYGIDGDKLHKHYNRDEGFVLDGYVEAPKERYEEFTRCWIEQAERILKPGGSIYIVSGYTHLRHVLNALADSTLVEVNHIIWKYNFGVYTRKKYVSSHYHILYYRKPGARHTFNTYVRFGAQEKGEDGGSLNYQDREDVWEILKEYKRGQVKNKNELPRELLNKMIQYSSNQGDIVADLFLGGFSTARQALALNRKAIGFEISESAFLHNAAKASEVELGGALQDLRKPRINVHLNQHQTWTSDEEQRLHARFEELRGAGLCKKAAIDMLMGEFQRGYFAILNRLPKDKRGGKNNANRLY